jgi:hypothetical protein
MLGGTGIASLGHGASPSLSCDYNVPGHIHFILRTVFKCSNLRNTLSEFTLVLLCFV